MVAEWEAAVTKFTELTPHLHYCTFSRRRASHRATLDGKPWRIVTILTIQTFYQQFNQEEANGSRFWHPGIFHWVIMDEAHRLKMSATPIGKYRQAIYTMVKMDSLPKVHYSYGVLYTQSGATIYMDVNGNHIGKWHQRHALDLALSGEFILVDTTAATRYIRLYSQLCWPLGHRWE